MSDAPNDHSPHDSDMVVQSSEVEKFFQTLRDFSEICETSRKAMEEETKEVRRLIEQHAKCITEHNKRMEKDGKKLSEGLRKQRKDIYEVKNECEAAEQLSSNAGKRCAEVNRAWKRINSKETSMCSYTEIVKQAETMTRQQYTRSLYAEAVCKEIANVSLSVLESAL